MDPLRLRNGFLNGLTKGQRCLMIIHDPNLIRRVKAYRVLQQWYNANISSSYLAVIVFIKLRSLLVV